MGSIRGHRRQFEVRFQTFLGFLGSIVHNPFLLKGQRGNRGVRRRLSREDLSLGQLLHLALSESEADLFDRVFSETLVLVKLLTLLELGVDSEMGARNNDLLVPVFDFLLFDSVLLGYHVVATHEDGLEELAI